jgi:hypothetical protein
MSIWKEDDISPVSHLYSYKQACAILQWNPSSTARIMPDRKFISDSKTFKCQAEVMLHADSSILILRENG